MTSETFSARVINLLVIVSTALSGDLCCVWRPVQCLTSQRISRQRCVCVTTLLGSKPGAAALISAMYGDFGMSS